MTSRAYWVRILFVGDPTLIRSALTCLGRADDAPGSQIPFEGHVLDGVADPFSKSAAGGYVVTVHSHPRLPNVDDVAIIDYARAVAAYVCRRLASRGVTAMLHYASETPGEFYECLEEPAPKGEAPAPSTAAT